MAKSVKEKLDVFLKEKFQETKLEDIIGDRFGSYSKYIIQERAIPDVRDGLKPVQRRILYGMNALRVTSNAPYKKSARIVGEVMGKFHPHGDSSIYEALVRMSQTWKMSVPLIDMHGNNGSIDGDGPAAMRYTEIRLAKNADYLLQDIDKNTVPFIPNFDEEEVEPTVLPAKFPNLLVNGAMGISSGYATYIPTHNLNEVLNATIRRIDNPNMSIDELLEIMPGPDFPTGGIIMGKEGIRDAFLTGSGSVTIRSKYNLETMSNGNTRIVITEIPYDTLKSKTVEKMEQLRMDGKVPDVDAVRDESGRDGLRIAIDLKKGANAEAIINYYFKNTDLQCNINYNMVAIANRRPCKLGILPILDYYIEHEKEVITNRTNYDLNKANKRLHIVIGLIKMVDRVVTDEVIRIIRASKNKQDSIDNLVKELEFSPEQAEAIVMMRLYSLSHQDIEQLKAEFIELKNNIEEYKKILSSEKELLRVIKKELSEINKQLVYPRKTEIKDESAQIKIDETDLVSKEQTMVCISKDGYLKRATLKAYSQSKSNGIKDNDSILFLKEVSTLDTLIIFTTLGNFIYLPVYKIPEAKFKDPGTYIASLVTIQPKEKFVSVYSFQSLAEGHSVLLATKEGAIKQTLLSQFQISRISKSVRCMKITDGDELQAVDIIKDPLEIVLVTHESEVLRFRASDVALYGTNAGGVKGINLKKGDYIVSAFYANKNDDIVFATSRDTIKRMKVTDFILTKRGRSGQRAIKHVKANPYYCVDAVKMTPNQYKEDVQINLIYSNGNDTTNTFTLKYNISDSGKQLEHENKDLNNLLKIIIDEAKKKDDIVSPDYLEESKIELFSDDELGSSDGGIFVEKPLSSKQNDMSILDDLDAILAKETKGVIKPKLDESEKEKKSNKEVGYVKLSLFDDIDEDNQ